MFARSGEIPALNGIDSRFNIFDSDAWQHTEPPISIGGICFHSVGGKRVELGVSVQGCMKRRRLVWKSCVKQGRNLRFGGMAFRMAGQSFRFGIMADFPSQIHPYPGATDSRRRLPAAVPVGRGQ
jgi:hypothetical protein